MTREALTFLGLSWWLPRRKVRVALVALLALLGVLQTPAVIAQDVPAILTPPQNVCISAEGIMTWDPVPGFDEHLAHPSDSASYEYILPNGIRQDGTVWSNYEPRHLSKTTTHTLYSANTFPDGSSIPLAVYGLRVRVFFATPVVHNGVPTRTGPFSASLDWTRGNTVCASGGAGSFGPGTGSFPGTYLGYFLLGAIGKAFRVTETQIDFYEIIEGTTQGVLAFRITQEEIDAALEAAGEATCVKASRNDRASVTVWADGNVTFSIGPDYETKIFHVLLEGGLGGPIIGHSTTYGPPAGAHCPNY